MLASSFIKISNLNSLKSSRMTYIYTITPHGYGEDIQSAVLPTAGQYSSMGKVDT
jgi:hypothetical protein